MAGLVLATSGLAASDHQGQVRFGEVPVQGAAVQATPVSVERVPPETTAVEDGPASEATRR